MKIRGIVVKNLRTTFRNWAHNLVFIICPVVAILIAGLLLNSVNVDNIRIGVVEDEGNSSLIFSLKESVSKTRTYSDSEDCLRDLRSKKVNLCASSVSEEGEVEVLEIYLDNSEKLVETYAKQFVLEGIREQQALYIEQSSLELGNTATKLSFLIIRTEKDLEETLKDLDEQEKILLEYRSDARLAQDNFNIVYYYLGDGPDTEITSELDETKDTIDNINDDIDKSLENVRETREKVLLMLERLEQGQTEIGLFSAELDDAGVPQANFLYAFPLAKDPLASSYPVLIAMIITFTSIIISNIFISRQINNPSHVREIISPSRDPYFMFGEYFTNLIFIGIEVIAIFLIGIYLLELNLIVEIYELALLIFLASSVFIFIGMFIGHIVKNQSLSGMVAIFTVIGLFIFSGILAPLSLIDNHIRFFVEWNPFVLFHEGLFSILLVSGQSIGIVVKLSFMLVGLIFLTYISKKIDRKRYN